MLMHRGRLELTWTNKDRALLTTPDGGYEWVAPTDHRVSEIRLLHSVQLVGDVSTNRADSNLLIRGDALHGLRALNELPEFADRYVGKVRVVYIDPPFNTGQAFANYDDALEHSVWLTMLRDRLVQIKSLLAPDGTVWVHLDDIEVHRARSVLDELFGATRHVGTVIWEKTDSPRMDATGFSVRHDTILVYSAGDAPMVHQLPSTRSNANRVDDDGRPYYLNPLRARGGQGSTRAARPNLYFKMAAPDGTDVYPKLPDGGDGAWRWGPDKVAADGRLIEWVQGRTGWNPYYRIYEREDSTRPPETIWSFRDAGSTRNSAAEIKALLDGRAFATPKPERLMQRIVHIATNPGDVVLDCFAGSGTTAAVAHKMGRRWVTIEASEDTVAQYTLPRLSKVIDGSDTGGISTIETPTGEGLPDGLEAGECRSAASTLEAMRAAGSLDSFDDEILKSVVKALRDADKTSTEVVWEGGGGFAVLDIGPSMFDEFEGRVYLADWAVNGALAEATAAQLGFAYELDAPFCGRKGKSRLAVIDGLVNEAVVRLLLDVLPKSEKLCVAGTALDPLVSEVLRTLSPGSSARKVPESLLDDYRQSRRTQLRLATVLDEMQAGEAAS
jgi:adenine-specific DNA-methyltransferase